MHMVRRWPVPKTAINNSILKTILIHCCKVIHVPIHSVWHVYTIKKTGREREMETEKDKEKGKDMLSSVEIKRWGIPLSLTLLTDLKINFRLPVYVYTRF